MLPATTIQDLNDRLNGKGKYFAIDGDKSCFGVFLCPYSPPLDGVRRQVLSNLPDWHCYSGKNFDVFWPGYSFYAPDARFRDAIEVTETKGLPAYYSSQFFHSFRTELQSAASTGWQFCGECDFLLFDVVTSGGAKSFDIANPIDFDVARIVKDGLYTSASHFAAKIFNLAEKYSGKISIADIANNEAKKVHLEFFRDLLLTVFPEPVKKYSKALTLGLSRFTSASL